MNKVYLLFITMFLSLHTRSSAQKDTLFYIGDPMCSWCYGFSPELDKVLHHFENLPFKIIVGGLRAHGDETVGQLSSFLEEHWKEIHAKTGQSFSYGILKNSKLIYNTEPACRAIVTIRSIAPEAEYSFFKSLQEAFYYKNNDPTSVETFKKLASSFAIEPTKFEKYFNAAVIINETERDFLLAQSLGVAGFPSLIALKDGKLHRITNGYTSAEKIISKMEDLGFKKTYR